MKKTILILLTFILTNVYAQEVLILDKPVKFSHYAIREKLKLDVENSKSWVEVIATKTRGRSRITNKFKTQVDGLSFNPTSSKIEFDFEGKTYECANVETKQFVFTYNVIKFTGECTFSHRFVKVPIEGSRRKQTRLQVFLNLN
jgi:hypothetical protein